MMSLCAPQKPVRLVMIGAFSTRHVLISSTGRLTRQDFVIGSDEIYETGKEEGATGAKIALMGRWPKAFRAFVRLTDKLLEVPRETLEKRLAEYRDQTAQKVRKRGPTRRKV